MMARRRHDRNSNPVSPVQRPVARFFNCLNSSEHPAAYLREGLPFYYEPARFARVLGDVPDADGNDYPVNYVANGIDRGSTDDRQKE
jgi:hypothetical protein